MKEKELREAAICEICSKPIDASGLPLFYRVRIERYVLNTNAIQRQQGLTAVLGSSAHLASVVGPDEDMADKISSTEVTVCETCSSERPIRIAVLAMRE